MCQQHLLWPLCAFAINFAASGLPRAEGLDPEYQADDKYPPWLFQLLDEKPMLEDFGQRATKGHEECLPHGEQAPH